MTMTIRGRNVNTVYSAGLWFMRVSGEMEKTRNGLAKVAPFPVMTVYDRPNERVLFDKKRDANPFFHHFEALWMLAGSNRVAPVAWYNSNIANYSDNGNEFSGAYGFRWRRTFGLDQIMECYGLLKSEPETRRAVIAMWDPGQDLHVSSKDIPCNTHIYFRIKGGALEMTVMCRSNDMVWGAYGANAVHFSMLHELMANGLGIRLGKMYQFSNNFHIYEKHWPLMDFPPSDENNPYDVIRPMPCLTVPESFEAFLLGCQEIVAGDHHLVDCAYHKMVSIPMIRAWDAYKSGSIVWAIEICQKEMPYCDWRLACVEWLERRIKSGSE
jgi:thymidylate synthase